MILSAWSYPRVLMVCSLRGRCAPSGLRVWVIKVAWICRIRTRQNFERLGISLEQQVEKLFSNGRRTKGAIDFDNRAATMRGPREFDPHRLTVLRHPDIFELPELGGVVTTRNLHTDAAVCAGKEDGLHGPTITELNCE